MQLHSTERISSSDNINISQSFFDFLFIKEKGGAISISASKSIAASIKECLFRFCFTEDAGGAIYAYSKSTSFSTTNSCFDTCSIASNENQLFGNALNIRSSGVGNAEVNQTLFYLCGPKLTFASDSTIFFQQTKTIITAPNFTDCYSYMGACTVGIRNQAARLFCMQSNRGNSLHITYVLGSEKFEIERSNMINWTQQYSSNSNYLFFRETGKTELKDCVIFVTYSYASSGNCIFTDCYGNLNFSDIISTCFTYYNFEEVTFGPFCGGFSNMSLNTSPQKILLNQVLVIGFLFPLLIFNRGAITIITKTTNAT